jgi:hypothetical protein
VYLAKQVGRVETAEVGLRRAQEAEREDPVGRDLDGRGQRVVARSDAAQRGVP